MSADQTARAVEHLVRAKQLLADLHRSARGADYASVANGVRAEVNEALSCLQEAVTGNREGRTRRDARATSERAARGIKVRSGTQRATVLLALAERDQTDHELSLETGIQPSSLRPRRGELVDEGYVAPAVAVGTGTPVTRRHGTEEWTVWQLTDAGRALAASLRRSPARVAPERGTQLTLD